MLSLLTGNPAHYHPRLQYKEITTWGQGPFKIKQDNVRYIQFNNERDLLNSFINWWMENTPDVVTGWNIQLFDIPFITKRIDRVLGEKLARDCLLGV